MQQCPSDLKRGIFRVLMLLLPVLGALASGQAAVVSGYVRDAETGEALTGASVFVQSGNIGQMTDKAGYFEMRLPESVAIDITFSYVGYASENRRIELAGDLQMEVLMVRSNRLLDVQVSAARRDFGVADSQMSATVLSVEQIKSVPSLFGETDVMKALQRLPGVQSGGDGTSGIYVRGGNYDQNLITLDGVTLYNSEHLKGFVSSLNADVIDNVAFFKGAFPARFGSRLSSVVDVGLKEGDYERYHASLTAGLLSSRIQAEGPVWRGHTSLNVAARVSYFDAIVQPALKKISDDPASMRPYAHMNYYDVNAKLTHRFSDNDKLSGIFYWSKDEHRTAPTFSRLETQTGKNLFLTKTRDSSTRSDWENVVAGLRWTHIPNDRFSSEVSVGYSRYDLRTKMATDLYDEEYKMMADGYTGKPFKVLERYTDEESYSQYDSKIEDLSLNGDFLMRFGDAHDFRWGAEAKHVRLTPVVGVMRHVERFHRGSEPLVTHHEGLTGDGQNVTGMSLYAEDDWTATSWLKVNAGLRYSLFAVEGKTYHSIEPRVSSRFLLADNLALKLSYSRMAQGIHQLSSGNLTMPSELWVPVTEDVPLMKSDQIAAGAAYEPWKGWLFSAEGYYKWLKNVIDYREGASFMSAAGGWETLVAQGDGRAYGIELLAQRRIGATTGWVSYTWSKSFRRYDRQGEEINGGKEFFALNDRRHNVNVVLTHRFNKHWEVSAAWTFQSGRRGNVTTTAMLGGKLDEYDAFTDLSSDVTGLVSGDGVADGSLDAAYLREFLRYYTFYERNGYRLPATHRLDIGANYSLRHRRCESIIGLTFYNLYNRQNVSNVYLGYHDNKLVLKGVCLFPFMPSLSYTIKF